MSKPTAAWVCHSLLRAGPWGNWHTDGISTIEPADACWQSWASMSGFQALITIQYLSCDIIGQGVFVNTIASMTLLATTKIALWYWVMFWSPLALGYGTFWSVIDLDSRMPGWLHGQTHITCWGVLTLCVWAMVVPLPQLNFGNLEAKGVPQWYQYTSVSSAAEPWYCISTRHSTPGQEVVPSVDDHPHHPPRCLCRTRINLSQSPWFRLAVSSLHGMSIYIYSDTGDGLSEKAIFGDTGKTKKDWLMGSIYFGDPGINWHHLIIHRDIHTLSFSALGPTASCGVFINPCNLYIASLQGSRLCPLTNVLHSSREDCTLTRIPFGCCVRFCGVLMLNSLASSFAISTQMKPKCRSQFEKVTIIWS